MSLKVSWNYFDLSNTDSEMSQILGRGYSRFSPIKKLSAVSQ